MAASANDGVDPGVESERARDDRILLATRIFAIVLAPILALAFVILYFWPLETGDRFAWPIAPEMTPLLMGGGYLSGAYYFSRLALGRRFSPVGVTMPAVAVFATSMALATVIHWENFTHSHLAFHTWAVVYFIAPPIVILLWFMNRKHDPGWRAGTSIEVPVWIRAAVGTLGAAMLILASVLILAPDTSSEFWPWSISPLTSRIIGGWFTLSGTASLIVAFDRRWSVWRVPLETNFIWTSFILLGLVRAWGDFDSGSASAWLYLAGVIGVILSVAAIYIYMERVQVPAGEYQTA